MSKEPSCASFFTLTPLETQPSHPVNDHVFHISFHQVDNYRLQQFNAHLQQLCIINQSKIGGILLRLLQREYGNDCVETVDTDFDYKHGGVSRLRFLNQCENCFSSSFCVCEDGPCVFCLFWKSSEMERAGNIKCGTHTPDILP